MRNPESSSPASRCIKPRSIAESTRRITIRITPSCSYSERKAIRRIPVIDQGRLAGVVTLGDLARHNDEESVLAAISEAPPNG